MVMTISSRLISYYFDVIGGRRKTLDARLTGAFLAVPAYCLWLPVSALLRWARLRGPFPPYRPDCPVISVGNITAGGTGKTPMVEWLCGILTGLDRRPALLTHHYRAAGESMNDESRLLAGRCKGAQVLSGKKRARLARRAQEEDLADCLLLDDGFQHLALARDLDIVLIDCLQPFGYGHPLPRGMLREPLSSLKRADAVVLTRSDLVDEERKKNIRDRIIQIEKNMPVSEAVHAPVKLIDTGSGNSLAPEKAKNIKAVLFCALGNPGAFRATAENIGVRVLDHSVFRDHHRYSEKELAGISKKAEKLGCEVVLTTEKDYIKIGDMWTGAIPLFVLRVAFRFVRGEQHLKNMITNCVRGNQ